MAGPVPADPGRRPAPGPAEPAVERSEIEALGATRAELGADYEEALLDSFADKVEAAVQRRLQGVGRQQPAPVPVDPSGGGRQLALGIFSVIATIPISITLGVKGQSFALIITLVALVAINWAHAVQARPQR